MLGLRITVWWQVQPWWKRVAIRAGGVLTFALAAGATIHFFG